MHNRTFELMVDPIGCARHELRALTLPVIHSTPEMPSGFGLIGPTGCGKTWALVQRVGNRVDAVVALSDDPGSAKLPFGFRPRWVNWPERAEQIKREIRDSDSLERWVDMAQSCSELYLDDIGRERTTGENDYSLGVLTEILDHRYRHEMPVFWTSNRSPEELGVFYSGRLSSRLLGAWPPFGVAGDDLRLKGVGI